MAEIKRVASMIPFLALRPDEFWVVRIMSRAIVDIKGDKRDCLTVHVYDTGRGPVPTIDRIIPALGINTPSPVLIGAHKALVDGFGLPGDKPEIGDKAGTFWLLKYNGQKSVGGSRKFNQWEMFEITLSEAELKTFNIDPVAKPGGKK